MLRKIDSVISIIALFLLLVHILAMDCCFISETYIFQYFQILSWILFISVLLHFILSFLCVSWSDMFKVKNLHDKKRLLQLISGICIFVFSILHIVKFQEIMWLYTVSEKLSVINYLIVVFGNAILFASIIIHCSYSFKMALFRLGLIKSKKSLDVSFWSVLVVLTIIMAVSLYIIARHLFYIL